MKGRDPMVARKLRHMHVIVRLALAALVTGGLMTAGVIGVTAARASAAPAPPKTTICLKNSKSWCVDVKDSKDVSGQPAWLYSSSGAKDDHWIEVPVPCNGTGGCLPNCDIGVCVAFEDAQNTSLCLAATASQGIGLLGCGLANGGTARAAWFVDGNGTELKNDFWASGGYLTVFGPLANRNALGVTVLGIASGAWQKWTGE
jgi:hypothetical protein